MTNTLTDLRPIRPSRFRQEARFVADELRAHPGRLAMLAMAAAVIVAVGYLMGVPVNLQPVPYTPPPSAPATATGHRPAGPGAAGVPSGTATGRPRHRLPGGSVRPSPVPGTESAKAPAAVPGGAAAPRPSDAPSSAPSSAPAVSSSPVVTPSTVIVTRPTCGGDGC